MVLSAGMKLFEISKLANNKSHINETCPNMYHLNTFNIPKHEGINKNWRVGGASKKPPENAMKLRESQLLHHLKPTQIMLKRKGFFTVLLARIKFYLQICAPNVSKTVPSC